MHMRQLRVSNAPPATGFPGAIAKAIALYRGSTLATGDMVQDHLRSTLTLADDNAIRRMCQSQNVPSMTRVAAGAFGFLIFSHAFDGPDLYGALSFFETLDHGPIPRLACGY